MQCRGTKKNPVLHEPLFQWKLSPPERYGRENIQEGSFSYLRMLTSVWQLGHPERGIRPILPLLSLHSLTKKAPTFFSLVDSFLPSWCGSVISTGKASQRTFLLLHVRVVLYCHQSKKKKRCGFHCRKMLLWDFLMMPDCSCWYASTAENFPFLQTNITITPFPCRIMLVSLNLNRVLPISCDR